MLHKLEEFNHYTPLGIRFWDSVLDAQVRNDLVVTACPVNLPAMKSRAYRTKGDIYSFDHLYGLRDLEYGYISNEAVTSPDSAKQFIVEVIDAGGRYINVAFPVGLPLSYPGVYFTDTNVSPYMNSPKGVYLFPSINRPVPSWMAVIRGELKDRDKMYKDYNNKVNYSPASNALLRVSSDNGSVGFGIADEEGRFAVVFAYPLLGLDFSASPVKYDTGPLHDQAWDLSLQVFYSPKTLEPLSGTQIPNYMSVINQSQANIWPESSSPDVPSSSLAIKLEFNKPVTLRTQNLSYLLVSKTDTSP